PPCSSSPWQGRGTSSRVPSTRRTCATSCWSSTSRASSPRRRTCGRSRSGWPSSSPSSASCPWTLMLPAVVRRLVSGTDDGTWFCVCWAVGVIGFFSLSRGGLGTYVLPAMPALALLTGRFVSAQGQSAPLLERRLVLGGLAVGAVLALLALVATHEGAGRWTP